MIQMILHLEFLEFLVCHLNKNFELTIVLMMFRCHAAADGLEYPYHLTVTQWNEWSQHTCNSAGPYERLCGLGLTVAVLDSSKGINKGSSGSKIGFSLFFGIATVNHLLKSNEFILLWWSDCIEAGLLTMGRREDEVWNELMNKSTHSPKAHPSRKLNNQPMAGQQNQKTK